MQKRSGIAFIIIFITGLGNASVTANPSVISHFSIEQGLSHKNINCIIQDSYGFLWIGTTDGLNRYDGYQFMIYKNNPTNNNSLPNNWITSLTEDQDKNIWIGTLEGLSKYDRKTKRFNNFFVNQNTANSISANHIEYLYSDNQNVLWIKTEQGLDKYDINNNLFSHFDLYNNIFNILTEKSSASILKDKNGKLWVGTKDGLILFDTELELYERFSADEKIEHPISNNSVNKIFEDHTGNLWIGTNYGMNLFQPERKGFITYYPFPSDKKNPANKIRDIIQDTKGVLLIATEAGLFKFENFSTFKKVGLTDEKGIQLISIRSLIFDQSDILWIATSNAGLYKFDQKKIKYNQYSVDDNSITSIFLQSPEELLLGTKNAGIYIYNRLTNQYSLFQKQYYLGKPGNSVYSIIKDNQENLWFGSENGLSIFNLNSKKIENQLQNLVNNNQNLRDNPVYSIFQGKNNEYWIGTKRGLHVINKNNIKSFYTNPKDSNSIGSNCISSIDEDINGNIWIGTSNGLNKLDIKQLFFSRYLKESPDTSKWRISNNNIHTLYIDKNNILWVGTASGLNKIDPVNGLIRIYTEADGLPNNSINGILSDSKNILWVSTNKGIARFDKTIDFFIAYDVEDGLQGYEFNSNSCFKTESGELFFGGIHGVNFFYPDSISLNEHIPPIVFTSLEIFNAKGLKQYPVIEKDTVRITHENNHFSIEFSALDFTRPEKCNYAYKMEGLEKNWIYIGNNRKAIFSNIPPGNYIFRVKGSNNDGFWNDTGTYIYITVEASYWQSKAAYVIYIVLFIFLVFLLFQYRTRNLRESNRILKEKELAGIEIVKQREELITKNKSITDSINYAKRIQEALLPSEKFFKSIFPSSFILYMPKDIVSGDFYWMSRNNNKIFLAVVDCTGHGVPGAFMSIIGFELLRNITIVQGIEDASEILNLLNKGLSVVFNIKNIEIPDYNGTDLILRDGMDMSLCVFDKSANIIEYAGAINPLYIVRDNKIIEVKGDRHTVGSIDEDISFTKHIISLEGADMIYLFTDGYTDQFGGPQDKKFKLRRFRHLILTIHKLSLTKQKIFLKETIENWKGVHEQVDDILVVGINPQNIG